MKAIVYTKYGSPEVLQIKEIDKPQPKANEVLVKTHASSINSWDWDLLTGTPRLYRLIFGLFKPKFQTLGCDISGIVEAVGENVSLFKPGDAVMGDISDRFGGFSEYVCTTEKSLIKKPEEISFETAAATPQAAVLAIQALFDKKPLQQGDKVLVNGAGGGVGTFALQMAKNAGAEVTCVDSSEKLKLLQSLGADHVIDYNKTEITETGKQYHLIIDVTISRSMRKYKKILLPGGVLAVVGGRVSKLLQIAFFGSLYSLFVNRKFKIVVHKANKNLKLITEMITSGKIKPIIDKTFTLMEVPNAMHYFKNGNFKGKIVISIP